MKGLKACQANYWFCGYRNGIEMKNWQRTYRYNILGRTNAKKYYSFKSHLEAETFRIIYALRNIYSGKFIAWFVMRWQLQPQDESVMHQPIPLVPFPNFPRELWRSGRVLDAEGGLLIFCYYTQRPGICLAQGQPCGRDLTLVCF